MLGLALLEVPGMAEPKENFDDDSYDPLEEYHRQDKDDEQDRAYFPVEESKPPHY